MIARLWTIYKLSAATDLVKRALRALPNVPFDVETIAAKMTARCYAGNANLFDGSNYPRPHIISTAIVALANELDLDVLLLGEEGRNAVFLALGNLLLDASRNSARYGLRDLDMRMLNVGQEVYLSFGQDHEAATDAIVGSLGI